MNFKQLIQKFPGIWALYWNNKWKRGKLLYQFESDGSFADIRTILSDTNEQIIKVGESLRNVNKTDDATAIGCLQEVMRKIRYVSDCFKYGKPEKWQTATETFASGSGDCEDGAILLMALMDSAGIPNWRRKIACGWVQSVSKPGNKGGHAYVIYLADDFNWYVLDWCYWSRESILNFKKIPHRDLLKYYDIWFTFNHEYCWTDQHDTIVKW